MSITYAIERQLSTVTASIWMIAVQILTKLCMENFRISQIYISKQCDKW